MEDDLPDGHETNQTPKEIPAEQDTYERQCAHDHKKLENPSSDGQMLFEVVENKKVRNTRNQ